MNKAFVKESDDEPLSTLPEMPRGVRNYITPAGYRHMQTELWHLLGVLRAATATVTAVGEQDPDFIDNLSEAQIRETEQRIHYLQTRLDTAEIVDPSVHADEQQIFFGASVTYQNEKSEQQSVTIVGLDELDPSNGKISWLSPVAQALLNAFEGDTVTLETPAANEELHILKVLYPSVIELDANGAGLSYKSVE